MYKIEDILNKVHQADCLDFMRLMKDESVDLVVTDIPYNISQKHGGLREIDYGDWDKNITIENVLIWIKEMIRVSKNGVYVFCGNEQYSYIFEEFKKNDMIVRNFVWLKPNPNIMNGQHFWLSSSELCICAKKRNTIYNGNCNKAYMLKKDFEIRIHPNQKPIEIMADFIKKSSNENDIIFDPFSGSGTTLSAAKQLKRNFIGIEISQKYVDITNKRLAQDMLF